MNKAEIIELGKEVLSIQPINKILNENECSFSFVAGSLVEGFGNEKSDIDIFIICKTLPVKKKIDGFFEIYPNSNVFYNKDKVVLTFSFQETDFDIEFHLLSELKGAIEKNNIGAIRTSDSYFDVLHRLKWSEPIMGEKNYSVIKSSVDYKFFSNAAVRYLSVMYSIKTTDIMGAYRAKDFRTAFFMSWSLLESCMDAFLSLHGETNPKNKWRIKKIERLESKPDYSDISLSRILDDTFSNLDLLDNLKMEQRIKEIMRNCQIINNSIQKGSF